MKRVITAAVMLAMAVTASLAWAEADEAEGECQVDICLDTEVVQGTVQRPGAFYVINRQRLERQPPPSEQSFTGEVVDSLRSDPF